MKVAITDVIMPVMSGGAFAQALRAIRPNVRLVVAMGMASETRRSKLAALDVAEILPKPHDPRKLRAAMRRVLAPTDSGANRN